MIFIYFISMDNLPTQLILKISDFITDPEVLFNFSLVCKKYDNLCKKFIFSKFLYEYDNIITTNHIIFLSFLLNTTNKQSYLYHIPNNENYYDLRIYLINKTKTNKKQLKKLI